MEWRQRGCVRISDIKTVAQLFEVGSNWNMRMEKLSAISKPKARKLYDKLDKRIDKIVELLKGADVCYTPEWYFEKKVLIC